MVKNVWHAFLFGLLIPFTSLAEMTVTFDNTVLVHASSPTLSDLKAVKLLQRHLRTSFETATGFEIAEQHQGHKLKGKLLIAVGQTKWCDETRRLRLKKYGYIVNSTSDSVICLYGNQDPASLLAATCLLDSLFDIRFYMPGNDFVHCPKRASVHVPSVEIRSEPFTDYVMATGLLTDFMNEYELGECWGLIRKDWGSHQHTMSERFPAALYSSAYPEIYPLQKGDSLLRYWPKTTHDQSWQPDFAHPQLVNAAVESSIAYFKKYPQLTHLAFSVQDSPGYSDSDYMQRYFERYEPSKAGRTKAYTHAFIDFINATAERLERELPAHGIHDRKTLVYIAYGQVRELPPVNLHPSVLPVTVYRIAEAEVLHLFDSLGKSEYIFQPFQWKEKCSRIGHHDWAQGYGFLFPRIYTELWKRYVQELNACQLPFEYAHLECYPNWGLDGPKLYLLAKVLWNPDADTDRILKRFCIEMFGAAAHEMFQYFKSLETLTGKMNNGSLRRKMWRIPEQLYLTSEELALARIPEKWLERAYMKALNEVQCKRIDLFKRSYKMSLLFMEAYSVKGNRNPEQGEKLFASIREAMQDKLTLYWSRNSNGEKVLIKYAQSLFPQRE